MSLVTGNTDIDLQIDNCIGMVIEVQLNMLGCPSSYIEKYIER